MVEGCYFGCWLVRCHSDRVSKVGFRFESERADGLECEHWWLMDEWGLG